MTEAEMRELVTQAYAARQAGRADDLASAFHDHAEFRFAADEKTLAVTNIAKGRASIREAMEGFITTFRFSDRKDLRWLFGGNQAAVYSLLEVTHVPSGTTFKTEIMDLFRFEGGKITELIEFADTAMINKILSG